MKFNFQWLIVNRIYLEFPLFNFEGKIKVTYVNIWLEKTLKRNNEKINIWFKRLCILIKIKKYLKEYFMKNKIYYNYNLINNLK